MVLGRAIVLLLILISPAATQNMILLLSFSMFYQENENVYVMKCNPEEKKPNICI
jgi:hypothetical protein